MHKYVEETIESINAFCGDYSIQMFDIHDCNESEESNHSAEEEKES